MSIQKNKNNFFIFILFFVFALSVFIDLSVKEFKNTTRETLKRPVEIEAIVLEKDLKKQIEIYKQLIDRVGVVQAQEDLYLSGLPFDGQTHLLNHEAGDWLYDKYGNEGLVYCKDYFLSSCHHGFVIKAIATGGMSSLSQVMKACWAQGATTATQCAHAIGHGILANIGYKYLPQAMTECDKVATISPNFPLYNCHDGAFMENIWAIHEGGTSKDQWVSSSDYLFPCNSPKFAEKYKRACWSNQPSRMYIMFKGDIKRIGEVCLGLTNKTYQTTCFDALARQIHPLSQGSVDKTFSMCSLMPSQEWINKCVASIAKASFSVGDRDIPYKICKKSENQELCFSNLIGTIKAYSENNWSLQNEWCEKIDANFYQRCIDY